SLQDRESINYEGTYYGGVAPAPFSCERPNDAAIAALPDRPTPTSFAVTIDCDLLWKTTKICKPSDALSSDQTSEFEANDVILDVYESARTNPIHPEFWILPTYPGHLESVFRARIPGIRDRPSWEADCNIDFAKGSEADFSQVKDDKSRSHLESPADPFMCDKTVLEDSFYTRVIVTHGENIKKCIHSTVVTISRDAFAKIAVIDKEMTEIQANCILNQPFALAQEKHSGSTLDQCHQCKTLCTLKDVRLIYATRLCIPDAIVVAHQLVVNYKRGKYGRLTLTYNWIMQYFAYVRRIVADFSHTPPNEYSPSPNDKKQEYLIEEAVIDEEMIEIQANCILNQPFALAQEKYSGSALDQCHQCKTLCTLKDVKLLYATRLCIPDAIVAAHQIVADQKELENPTLTEWDRFGHREYIRISMEEDASNGSQD
ncbi:hypothetical protein Tco_0291754, partial [Tanacetum coccineum]